MFPLLTFNFPYVFYGTLFVNIRYNRGSEVLIGIRLFAFYNAIHQVTHVVDEILHNSSYL